MFAVVCAPIGGCAGGFSTQASRLGPDDGTDPCRRELVALDDTGNFFGESIVKGALLGALGGGALGGLAGRDWRSALIGAGAGAAFGAATAYWTTLQQQQGQDRARLARRVQEDLERENGAIDRSQAAFDALADCRFRQAQAIRTAFAAGSMPRAAALEQMERVRARSQRDIQLARLINGRITERGAQFEVAADNLSPGTQGDINAARSAPPHEAVSRDATYVTLRPSAASPNLASLRASETVRVVGTRGAYAVVETSGGERGYAPLSALDGAGRARTEPSADGNPVRTLAGSNAARRDDFAASVAVTEQAAARQFELAS